MTIRVTLAGTADASDWQALRDALWPHAAPENAAEIAAMIAAPDLDAFIARNADGTAVGFAEVALRHDYVNGCETSPVGFLEGIYVVPSARRQGVARALVGAVRDWARSRQCSELASDAMADNFASHAMHRALGFTETDRVVFFRQLI